MSEIENKMSVLDIFGGAQETFAEAKQKMADESRKSNKYLRMTKDGTYLLRILPLAPEMDADGNILPMKRKGYEYPLRDLLLKIEDPTDKKKTKYVTVCNVTQAYPQLTTDLIDKFVEVASNKYASDTTLVKKLKEGSFSGGLRWSAHRAMYVLDMDNREEGIQILMLSYSQYKELEERKMNLWQKALKKNSKALCPISSPMGAYPVEITRKTEAKTTYSINIAVEEDKDELTEEELKTLFDTQQLPAVLYRYTRYHLEATLAYLKQVQERYDIDVLEDEEIKNCIDQIKMVLPADDQSHFQFGDSNDDDGPNENNLDELWNSFDKLKEEGLDDRSEEGQELRAAIKEFIENNDLTVRVSRGKSNLDLLNEIENELGGEADEEPEPEPQKAPRKRASKPTPEPEPVDEPEPDDGENDDEEPVTRRSRNDDTNEPATRPERRSARPQRRRS